MAIPWSVDLDYTQGGGMSWNGWVRLLDARMGRALAMDLPSGLVRMIWKDLGDWVEHNLFSGTVTPEEQWSTFNEHGAGKYGGISSVAHPDPKIMNPWEKYPDADEYKRKASKRAKKDPQQHADVMATKGPPFLASMRRVGPTRERDHASLTIGVHTLATMTPYDPSAGGTRPIMHYLKHGWRGKRAQMVPRWPMGVAFYMWQDYLRPYQRHLAAISHYLVKGR